MTPKPALEPSVRRGAWLALLVVLVAVVGCSERVLHLRLRSASNVNDQRSVYVLVRAVKEADYRLESYDEIAARVVHPDESVLDVAVALPGVPLSFSLKPPEKGQIAVYALFERPVCDAWRVLLPKGASQQAELRIDDGKLCLVGERGECVAQGCSPGVSSDFGVAQAGQ